MLCTKPGLSGSVQEKRIFEPHFTHCGFLSSAIVHRILNYQARAST